MKDSALRLQDKTVLLVGPFNGVSQAILRTMTEFGTDVGLISEHQYAGKFVEAINEAREVHAEYGRAAHLPYPLGDEKQIAEAIGRMVESLGRVDILIDVTALDWSKDTDAAAVIEVRRTLAQKVIPFFQAKQRGRIVYLFEDSCLDNLHDGGMNAACRSALTGLIESLAKSHRGQNITVNGVTVGLTDDFLLKNMPKSPSLKRSFEEVQSKHPGLKLVEFHDVSLGTVYAASTLSASLTGQVLRLTHGFHL
jgi:NAD(P)-dependent dehydrogenase (short-subunit alcohol dehydrogenase family)